MMSHREIARVLGISKSLVQKIETQALRKLRRWLRQRGIGR